MTTPLRLTLWGALAGHALVLLAQLGGWWPLVMTVVAGAGCSIAAISALTEWRRAFLGVRAKAWRNAHVIALAGIVGRLIPGCPTWIPTIAFGAAIVTSAVGLLMSARAAEAQPTPQPVIRPLGIVCGAIVAQSVLAIWSESSLTSGPAASIVLIALEISLGTVVFVATSMLVLRSGAVWLLLGLLAWLVSWIGWTADLLQAAASILGASLDPQSLPLSASYTLIFMTFGYLWIGAYSSERCVERGAHSCHSLC